MTNASFGGSRYVDRRQLLLRDEIISVAGEELEWLLEVDARERVEWLWQL